MALQNPGAQRQAPPVKALRVSSSQLSDRQSVLPVLRSGSLRGHLALDLKLSSVTNALIGVLSPVQGVQRKRSCSYTRCCSKIKTRTQTQEESPTQPQPPITAQRLASAWPHWRQSAGGLEKCSLQTLSPSTTAQRMRGGPGEAPDQHGWLLCLFVAWEQCLACQNWRSSIQHNAWPVISSRAPRPYG